MAQQCILDQAYIHVKNIHVKNVKDHVKWSEEEKEKARQKPDENTHSITRAR